MLPELMTPKMVNEYFRNSTGKGIRKEKLYEMFHNKYFPSFRIGRKFYVRTDKFIEWMDKQSKIK